MTYGKNVREVGPNAPGNCKRGSTQRIFTGVATHWFYMYIRLSYTPVNFGIKNLTEASEYTPYNITVKQESISLRG